jgi:hypothetical protein
MLPRIWAREGFFVRVLYAGAANLCRPNDHVELLNRLFDKGLHFFSRLKLLRVGKGFLSDPG